MTETVSNHTHLDDHTTSRAPRALALVVILLILSTACNSQRISTPTSAVTPLPTNTVTVTVAPTITRIPTATPSPTPLPDLVPPEPVLDLVGTDSTTNTITLAWTAPSDNRGALRDYDVRFSDAPITAENWNTAVQLEEEPQPQTAGQPQTYTLAGLAPNRAYFFALRTRDAAGSLSDVSNTVAEATLLTRVFDIGVPSPDLEGGEFLGFGAEWDPFYWTEFSTNRGADEAGWGITTARIQELGLPFVRMMMDLYWVQKSPDLDQWTWEDHNFKAFLRQLDFAQANNIDVILTDWGWVVNPALRGSAFYKANDERYARGIAQYLKELIDVRGYTAIKYLTVINEPDTRLNTLYTLDEYVQLYKNLDTALRENGMRDKIKLMGPDVAYDAQVFADAAKQLHGVIDVYDLHHYAPPSETSNVGLADAATTTWERLDGRRSDVLAADPQSHTKEILVTELAPNFPEADTFRYALHMADLGTTLLSTRLNGASVWTLQDMYYFDNPKLSDIGLWHFADLGWSLKPLAQVYALLVKYAPRGSIRAAVNKTPPAVPPTSPYRSAAVMRPDGGWSIFLVNQSQEAIRASIRLPKAPKYPLARFQIDSTTLSQYPNTLFIPAAETLPPAQQLRVTIPAQSFIVLAELLPTE